MKSTRSTGFRFGLANQFHLGSDPTVAYQLGLEIEQQQFYSETLRMSQPTRTALPKGVTAHTTVGVNHGAFMYVEWSPDGSLLASTSTDRTVQLWDTSHWQVRRTISGHPQFVNQVAWAPDSRSLASASFDRFIRLWDAGTGQGMQTLRGHGSQIFTVAWSPDGLTLASGSDDRTVRLWNMRTFQSRVAVTHVAPVSKVAWRPVSCQLASAAWDGAILVSDTHSEQTVRIESGHSDAVTSVAWSPDGTLLASASRDRTVRIWDINTKRLRNVLEGHTDGVTDISFSFDGKLLASTSLDGTIRLWSTHDWRTVSMIGPQAGAASNCVSFHPRAALLASLGEHQTTVQIWDIDRGLILGAAPRQKSVYYTNAKIVLVGDSGVGKSALGSVLNNQKFAPTDSTHGRHVWMLFTEDMELEGAVEKREVLLWDLAGQQGYRLIHQLTLNEVAVALLVFDSRNETDPFGGVRYWDRALREARRVSADSSSPPLEKFLVSARADRAGLAASQARIRSLQDELGCRGYFETSAKEGWNIANLADALRAAINWELMPKVSSSELFQSIRSFLLDEKDTGRSLVSAEDLYRTFLKKQQPAQKSDISDEFETCVRLMETRGLIRRLSFGGLILLQPELLDAYAAAILQAAKEEPDGLGCITEEKAVAGGFRMSEDIRIPREQEKLLLIATVEDLLRHEVAVREQADGGPYLVFPSQLTRELPEAPDPKGKAAIFQFEGPIQNIYATLAVRLSHCGLFHNAELWKNAAIYVAKVGGRCGIFLRDDGDGAASLTVFFDESSSREIRLGFEEYVRMHLERRALPESLNSTQFLVCTKCGAEMNPAHMTLRRERGFESMQCPVCETRISLVSQKPELRLALTSNLSALDRVADDVRDRQAGDSVQRGREAAGDFDIFLSYSHADTPAVEEIAKKLKERGILPWLDKWELPPGSLFQRAMDKQLKTVKSAAVFLGPHELGPWQTMEHEALVREFVRRELPVIPVILRDCKQDPQLPTFLQGCVWVDFRKQEPDPVEHLIWGIRRTKPNL